MYQTVIKKTFLVNELGWRLAVGAFLLSMAVWASRGEAEGSAGGSDVLLTIFPSNPSQSAGVELDREQLEAFRQIEFETSTIWSEGVRSFSGPSLREVLIAAGITGGDINLTAENQYRTTMPWFVMNEDFPIIATRIDGETFSLREKGPLWIVFPYDADEKYRTEVMYAHSIWQLVEIGVAE